MQDLALKVLERNYWPKWTKRESNKDDRINFKLDLEDMFLFKFDSETGEVMIFMQYYKKVSIIVSVRIYRPQPTTNLAERGHCTEILSGTRHLEESRRQSNIFVIGQRSGNHKHV